MPLYLRESNLECSIKPMGRANIVGGYAADDYSHVMITQWHSSMAARIVSPISSYSVQSVTISKQGPIYSVKVTYTVGELSESEAKGLLGLSPEAKDLA